MAELKLRYVLVSSALGELEITAPVGWDDSEYRIVRDAKYHGVNAMFTFDYSFIKDGRDYLKTIYNTFGIEAVVLFIVYEYEPNEGIWNESYNGRINLANARITDDFFIANAEQTGFTRKLLNLEDVEVDLQRLVSLEGTPLAFYGQYESTLLNLHSKAIIKRYTAKVSSGQPAYNFRPVDNSNARSGNIYIGFDDVEIDEFNAFTYQTGMSLNDEELQTIEFVESGTITVSLKANIHVRCFKIRGGYAEAETFFFMGINTQREQVYYYKMSVGAILNNVMEFDVTRTYNVSIGDKLYIYGRAQVGEVSGNYEFEWQVKASTDCALKISGATTTAPTSARGYMIHEAMARTVASITGRDDAFYSELLGRTDSAPISYPRDGAFSHLFLTNGSQIRGFPMFERPVFAALKDEYDSLDAITPVGLGVELLPNGTERVRLEDVDFFYKDDVVVDLGIVSDLAMYPAKEYYYTNADFGYEKWGSNQDNSLDEFNTKQTRSLPITQEKGKYSKLSKYVASGYLIEEMRRQTYATTPTKESGNDKVNFWICVLRTLGGWETERNQRLAVAENVLSPSTIYNAAITPMRNAIRHGKLLRVPLIHLEQKPVPFLQGNSNYLFRSQLIGEPRVISEDMQLFGSDLVKPKWRPEYFEFTAPLPLFKRKLIERNPYGIITFMDSSGTVLKGYLKEARVKLTDGTADFKLLRYNETV